MAASRRSTTTSRERGSCWSNVMWFSRREGALPLNDRNDLIQGRAEDERTERTTRLNH